MKAENLLGLWAGIQLGFPRPPPFWKMVDRVVLLELFSSPGLRLSSELSSSLSMSSPLIVGV